MNSVITISTIFTGDKGVVEVSISVTKIADMYNCQLSIKGLKKRVIRSEFPFADLAVGLSVTGGMIGELLANDASLKTQAGMPCWMVYPRHVPITYGLEFYKLACDLIDSEKNRVDKELHRKRKAR
jgi:hypothetical protein